MPNRPSLFDNLPDDYRRGPPGSQSGEGLRRTDGVFLQQPPLDLRNLPAPEVDPNANWEGQGFRNLVSPKSPATAQSGMRGTPSGPADESALMSTERFLQGAIAHPLGVGLGAAGLIASGGNPLALIPGIGAGGATMDNALSPDINDVWAHRARNWLQQKYLSLFGSGDEPQTPSLLQGDTPDRRPSLLTY